MTWQLSSFRGFGFWAPRRSASCTCLISSVVTRLTATPFRPNLAAAGPMRRAGPKGAQTISAATAQSKAGQSFRFDAGTYPQLRQIRQTSCTASPKYVSLLQSDHGNSPVTGERHLVVHYQGDLSAASTRRNITAYRNNTSPGAHRSRGKGRPWRPEPAIQQSRLIKLKSCKLNSQDTHQWHRNMLKSASPM